MSILFSDVKQRYQDLIGQPSGTISAFGKRNCNQAVRDILNMYRFSWNLTTEDLTLASGTDAMAATYNPRWGLHDARITGSSQNDDNVFTEITIPDRDKYSSDDYVFWVTYDATNQEYDFNSLTQTGTVTIYNYFTPADMSADGDKCIIPDLEAVAYKAASKNWIGAERDVDLKKEYEAEANKYITAMYLADLQSGPQIPIHSLAIDNLAASEWETNVIIKP